jgi:hypothetical protein
MANVKKAEKEYPKRRTGILSSPSKRSLQKRGFTGQLDPIEKSRGESTTQGSSAT